MGARGATWPAVIQIDRQISDLPRENNARKKKNGIWRLFDNVIHVSVADSHVDFMCDRPGGKKVSMTKTDH